MFDASNTYFYYMSCSILLLFLLFFYKKFVPLSAKICPDIVKYTVYWYFFLSCICILVLFFAKKFSWISDNGETVSQYGTWILKSFIFFTNIDTEIQCYVVFLSIVFIPLTASYLFCGAFGIGRFPIKGWFIFRWATVYCAKGFISFSAIYISTILSIEPLKLTHHINPEKFKYADIASFICFFAFLMVCVFSKWEAWLEAAHLRNNIFFNFLEHINKYMTRNEIDSTKNRNH